MPATQLLRLLHLASPALPVGGFHFSQGLEYAVEAQWVRDEASAREWILGLAAHAVGTVDLPVALRLQRAYMAGDHVAASYWSEFLLAARETDELRAEDRHIGRALARILAELDVCRALDERQRARASFAASFARACAAWSIAERAALQTYLWVWTENQTLAAVKLVPLGQTAGQRILNALIPHLETIVERALTMPDAEIGTGSVMQAFASARHETQYTRLFRS
jgi:urease accessory protein